MDNNKKAHIEEFKKYILARALKEGKDPSKYTEDELKSMYLDFMKLKTQKAAHGAKLQYFKSLKNQCPEGEELYYYKKGGSVGCGCKKKENGGEIKKKSSIIDKFKAIRKASLGDTLGRIADATGSQGGFRRASKEKPSKKIIKPKTTKPASGPKDFKNDYSSQRVKDSEKDYLEGNADHKVKKNCGGSKMKLQKKGGEVCPKCGKVHSTRMGCAVAKFKMHRQGGSLNGIPFMLLGTFKGGVLYRFRRSTNDMNNGYRTHSDLIMMTLDPLGHPTYDTPPISAGRTIYVTPLGNDTIFYTNNDIFNKTPKGDLNLKKAKLKFYQLIKKAPIEGEEYRMTPYWNSNLFNLDTVRNRALKGN